MRLLGPVWPQKAPNPSGLQPAGIQPDTITTRFHKVTQSGLVKFRAFLRGTIEMERLRLEQLYFTELLAFIDVFSPKAFCA